ncbi:MAG: NTP transferase domain-containing protein [Armatimonadetes bacterium]|nr:NTP transferase domain-containing protein [Armatimonadota bacterium]
MTAMVMAGGINTIPLYEGYTPGYKALVQINGRPAIRYPLAALRASRYIGDVCVVGQRDALAAAVADESITIVPSGETLFGSVVAGLKALRDRPLVLGATADLSLLTGTMVDAFLQACAAIPVRYKENIFVSVVPREDFTGPFALTEKLMVRFRDGTFCHGNLMLLQPGLLDNRVAMARINAIYAGRKGRISSALAFGPLVGLAFVFGVYFLHLLTMRQMAAIASRRFGLGIIPVPIPYAQVSLDVDEPTDYRLVTEVLALGQAGG